jgi:hypothetical protein
MSDLILKRATATGEVYDVLSGHRIVGRIMLSGGSAASQWVWTLAYGHHEDRTPTHGYEASREAAMLAFANLAGRELNQIRSGTCGAKSESTKSVRLRLRRQGRA